MPSQVMLSKKEIVHPSHSHPLSVGTDKRFINHESCNVCREYMKDFKDYYYCPKEECKYNLHIKCFKLKETTQEYHPLHPHHPLTLSFTIPNNNGETKYECSFCRETKSGYFYHCGHHQCDFRIDLICFTNFPLKGSELLRRFEFQHFLHDHKLSPLKFDIKRYFRRFGHDHDHDCNGCGVDTFGVPVLGCKRCSFYLHPLCSQVPKEMVHPFHPQHTLTLSKKPPADELRCIACRKRIKDAFVLHCTQCPFNLDIGCAFLKPSVKHDRHKHLLAHFEKIDLDDVLCIACNKVCDADLFRCFACDFNIHSGSCMSVPSTVDYDDHIHPLTLISSYREDDSNQYYCFVCEEIRDPDYGAYHCEECKLAAHIECVLPKETSSISEEIVESSSTEKQEEIEENEDNTTEEDIEVVTSYEMVSVEHTILLQLDVEMAKIREEVKGLKKQLGEKLKELEEREGRAESMLKELKEKFNYMN